MKKIFLAFLLLFPLSTFAQSDTGWVIDNFHSDLFIQENGKVLINEYIDVDFGSLQKHGIYRDLPLLYKNENGKKEILKINSIVVSDIDGNSIMFDTTRTNSNLNLKIGHPDILVTGKQNYFISYEVEGALKDLGEVDELFWNVTGNNWVVPVKNITATIFMPKDVTIHEAGCFEGPLYSKDKCPTSNYSFDSESGSYFAFFNSSTDMNIGSGLSVYATYDTGIIPAVTFYQNPFYLFLNFLTFIIVMLATIILNIVNWYKHGRDYMYTRNKLYENDRKEILKPLFHKEPITVLYEPPSNLRPGLMGTLIDEKFNPVDFVSTVIDLTVRGYIEITEKEAKAWYEFDFSKDYYIKKIKEPDDKLLEYEKLTMENIFSGHDRVSVNTLNKNFYSKFVKIESSAEEEAKKQGLFVKNIVESKIKSMKGETLSWWFFAVVISFVLAAFTQYAFFVAFGFSLFLSLVITMIVLSITAPQKTAKGRELYIESLGYRDFIKSVDKYRAKFYEDNNMFVQTLPYAIMFGMTDKYLKAMESMGIDMSHTSGFRTQGGAPFSSAAFASSMSSFASSMIQTATSSPRSSSGSGGGGFSGGGGGGGGGGSW